MNIAENMVSEDKAQHPKIQTNPKGNKLKSNESEWPTRTEENTKGEYKARNVLV